MEVPPPPPPPGLKWDSVTLSDGIVNVDEDDTKAEIRKKIKDALDTKLPLDGTDDFDMIHLLCLLPTGSDVWQAVYHMHNCPKVITFRQSSCLCPRCSCESALGPRKTE